MTESPTELQTRIALNIADVRARIDVACERAGRDPAGVTLIGVSKTHPADVVAAVYAAGLQDFGENRVQEGVAKVEALRAQGIDPSWHLIGTLQRNKVNTALRCFTYVHSIDSERLAAAIDERATEVVRAFIEVNVAGEASKSGVVPRDVDALAVRIATMPNIELCGLMTVAPLANDAEAVRPVFRRLRELRDAIGLQDLSMGMTGDFEVAVEEGATFVRVGRAIFGERGR